MLVEAARYRLNFLYFSRCGMMQSCPGRRILSASWYWKLPSNHSTWLSPSKIKRVVISKYYQ
jgi:hypothetical protein